MKTYNGIAQAEMPVMLVVEDDEDMRFFISDHFSDTYRIHTAINGIDGMRKALDIIPDIIISDVMMPGMSGIDMCRNLKENKSSSHIPIILLTARDSEMAVTEGYLVGADDYISKPFSTELLDVRAGNLLKNRKRLRDCFLAAYPDNFIKAKTGNGMDSRFMHELTFFIDTNIDEPVLNVEKLSDKLNMSRVSLYRKIKSLTGLSVIEFIREYKIKKAAELLLQSTYNVNEVCYKTGFSDVDYFRKCFKSQYGLSPKEYACSKKSALRFV